MTIEFSEQALIGSYIANHPDFTAILVDVGAHIGLVTMQFAKMDWRVIAFEPEPSNYQRLLDNVGTNERVTIIHKAVSDKENDSVDFYISSKHYGIHSLKPFHDTHTEKITVKTTRIDKNLQALDVESVGFLKIDIEGADFLALKSFDFDSILPQLIMVEFMDERSVPNFDYTYHDMVTYLAQYGYEAWVSEWSAIQSYGIEGQGGGDYHFIQCAPYRANADVAWGNLIFMPEQDTALFQRVLDSYMARQIRHAKGTQRRRTIESLPAGKMLYKYLSKIKKLL